MADAEASSAAILRLINGYQVSQAIHVAAALGLADELAEGPRAVGELASVTATTRARCTGCCARWPPWRSCGNRTTERSR